MCRASPEIPNEGRPCSERRLPSCGLYGVMEFMKTVLKRVVAGGSLGLALVFLGSGCAAVVVGGAAGAGVAYSMGALKSVENTTVEKAYIAAQAALKDLEFRQTLVSKDAVEARVEGETSSDKTVTIHIAHVTDQATEIRVRVGTFGDEKLSRLIFEKMRAHF
jgi:hypothetical protein